MPPLHNTSIFLGRVLEITRTLLIPIVIALAILAFLFGVTKYIWSVGAGGKEEGKRIMIWGVIALAVMSSVWGIVRFLQQDLGITDLDSMKIPKIER